MSDDVLLHKRRYPHEITKATSKIQEKKSDQADLCSDKLKIKLLTDTTKVQCTGGKLYVSPVMDFFIDEIVALEMPENMKKELCIDTVKQLGRLKDAIFHGDRGSQYTSDAFRAQLKKIGMGKV